MKLLFRGFLVLLLVWLVGAYFVPKRMQNGPLGIAIQLHPANLIALWADECAREQRRYYGEGYYLKGGSERLERAHSCLSVARTIPAPFDDLERGIHQHWLLYLNFAGRDAEALEGWLQIVRSDDLSFSIWRGNTDNAEAWESAVWSAQRMGDHELAIQIAREGLAVLSSPEFARRVATAVDEREWVQVHRAPDDPTAQIVEGIEISNWTRPRLSLAEKLVINLVEVGRAEEAVEVLDDLYAQEPFVSGRFDLTEHHAAMNSVLGEALDDRARLEAALAYWRPVVEGNISRLSDPDARYPNWDIEPALTRTINHLEQLGRCDEARMVVETLPIGADNPFGEDLPEYIGPTATHNWMLFQCYAASISADSSAEAVCHQLDQFEADVTSEQVEAYGMPIFERPRQRVEPSACFLSE
ncbi:MAG: hypothetical protein QUV02_04230 [Maricaulis sp.]|uniref:hypothetical protein n=1 Tax=Maricaulis sp. TaxID=1486257 RepID=UPI002636DF85|nr:hypothetical protein [Maricaulis sp.]MDM7983631.1 hypothetical protein [Maricaulis sp.]